jgi:biopolymer transport protein ExbD
VCLSVWVLQTLAWTGSTGLTIHLVNPGITAKTSPWIQPLRVRLEAVNSRARPNLYIDAQLVSWEDFSAVLHKELNHRPPNWPVYLEGNGNMEWRQAVQAIDAIRGLHAEVVLLTRLPRRKIRHKLRVSYNKHWACSYPASRS